MIQKIDPESMCVELATAEEHIQNVRRCTMDVDNKAYEMGVEIGRSIDRLLEYFIDKGEK